MAINFPNSPAINDIFASSGLSWKWDGVKWIPISNSPLGLGTAAIENIGITGHAVPLLDGINTWTVTQIISLAAGSIALQLKTVDPGVTGPLLQFYHDTPSPAINDVIYSTQYHGRSSTGIDRLYADDYAFIVNPTNAAEDASRTFRVMINGVLTSRMTLNATGVSINGTATAGAFSSNAGITAVGQISAGASVVASGNSYSDQGWFVGTPGFVGIGSNPAGYCYMRPNGYTNANGQAALSTAGRFSVDGGFNIRAGYGAAGSGGSTFNFNYASPNMTAWIDTVNVGVIATGSDYRIKKDVVPLASTWKEVMGLRPVSFTWDNFKLPDTLDLAGDVLPGLQGVSSDELQWGFIAHEVQEDLLPCAAHGHKDEENVIQSLNFGPIVAATVRALQEAMVRIEYLETKIAVLEGISL